MAIDRYLFVPNDGLAWCCAVHCVIRRFSVLYQREHAVNYDTVSVGGSVGLGLRLGTTGAGQTANGTLAAHGQSKAEPTQGHEHQNVSKLLDHFTLDPSLTRMDSVLKVSCNYRSSAPYIITPDQLFSDGFRRPPLSRLAYFIRINWLPDEKLVKGTFFAQKTSRKKIQSCSYASVRPWWLLAWERNPQ